MYTHLHDSKYYEDIYDRSTVNMARSKVNSFMNFYQEWFKMMPYETPDSPRSSFNLNWIYMLMVESDLVDRYEDRENHIQKMMDEDRQKDDQLLSARLLFEPICQHCGKSGLRIVSKDLRQLQLVEWMTWIVTMKILLLT